MSESKKYISKQEAKTKIEFYCSYQERCQQEVKKKLYTYQLKSDEVDELLLHLIKNGFLNEERFAKAYAGGKFRQKGWGRNKILQGLKQREISAFCIKQAMKEIDDLDYKEALLKSAEKYRIKLKGLKPYQAKIKTIRHLMSKGFEYDICQKITSELFE